MELFGVLRMRLLLLLVCLLLSAPAAAAPFSADAYDSCIERIALSDAGLLTATPETKFGLQQQSIAIRSECTMQFEEWMTQPDVPSEYREAIAESLKVMFAELTFMLADAGQCLQARGWLTRWRATPNIDQSSTGFVNTKTAVDRCGAQPETTVAQAPAPQVTEPKMVDTSAAPPPVRTRSRVLQNWGYGLLGTASLMGVGGLLYNSAGAEERDEYKVLAAACKASSPSCDQQRANTLATSIEEAKAPLLAIYGLAGAAGLTGATFVMIDLIDGDDARTTRLFLSPTAIQVAVRW